MQSNQLTLNDIKNSSLSVLNKELFNGIKLALYHQKELAYDLVEGKGVFIDLIPTNETEYKNDEKLALQEIPDDIDLSDVTFTFNIAKGVSPALLSGGWGKFFRIKLVNKNEEELFCITVGYDDCFNGKTNILNNYYTENPYIDEYLRKHGYKRFTKTWL